MNDKIKSVSLAMLCAAGVQGIAAEQKPPAVSQPVTPGRAVPAQLDGTILAVNPKERTVPIDVKGRLLTVNVTKQLKISKNGKLVGFEELAPGQSVSLGFIELPNGQIEVASVTVASTPEGLEAAGGNGKGQEQRRVPTLPPQAPFTTPPNPANVGAPPISKHK